MSSERVRGSWKEDALFGYQFLNGANPMLLRRSMRLPARLVLPPGMEDVQTQLEKELKVLSCLCLAYAPNPIPMVLTDFFPFPCFLPPHLSLCDSIINTLLYLHLGFLFLDHFLRLAFKMVTGFIITWSFSTLELCHGCDLYNSFF